MTYRFLASGTISIHDDRWFVPPWGVNGGEPGKRARKILEKADGSTHIIGNKVEDVHVDVDDQLHFITWGGASRPKVRAIMAWLPMQRAKSTWPRQRHCEHKCAPRVPRWNCLIMGPALMHCGPIVLQKLA